MGKTITQTRLLKVSVPEEMRLDLYIKDAASVSRGASRAMIDSGQVFVNSEKQSKYHRLVRHGDDVSYQYEISPGVEVVPFKKKLDIVYDGVYFIAVNKPSGMLTHPTKFGETDTLVNAVKDIYPDRTIHAVNRLDKLTSGIVLVALDKKTAGELSDMIEKRLVHKEYSCLVHGRLNKSGRIDLAISEGGNGARLRETVSKGGMSALTFYEPLEICDKATLLKVVIKTGRTHQIRAHMKSIGHPVIGDPVYGDKDKDIALFGSAAAPERQMLHAGFMEFRPHAGAERISIKAPMPEDFLAAIEAAGKKKV